MINFLFVVGTNWLSHAEIVLFKADKSRSSVGLGEQIGNIFPDDNNINCIADKPIKIIKLGTTHDGVITCTKEIVEQIIGDSYNSDE